jgi:hypothetical protein
MRKKLYLITTLFTLAAAITTGCGSSKENTANTNSGNEAVANESTSAESDGLGDGDTSSGPASSDGDTSSGAASSDNDNSSVVASSESEGSSDAPASGSEAETDEHTADFSVTTDENGNEEVTIDTDEIKTDENGESYVTVGDVDVKVEVADGKVIVADENVKEAVKTAVKENNNTDNSNTNNSNNSNSSTGNNSSNGNANSGSTNSASKITVSLSNDNGKVVVSTPTPTPKVTAKVTDTVTDTAKATDVVKPSVTKTAEATKSAEIVVATNTPVPTSVAKSTGVAESTPTPTKTLTKAPTNTPKPTSTPKVTPTPKLSVKSFLVMKDVTVRTSVSSNYYKGATDYIVLYYVLNDTAPDYPYITSHSNYTVEAIEKFIDMWINDYNSTREKALTSLFISAASDKYHSTYSSCSNFVIGQEEVEVEVTSGGIDFEDTSYGDGFPTFEYTDEWGNTGMWKSVKNTIGCIYSDGTKEYWKYDSNGNITSYLTKLK